jgi:hypothetical protein
MGLESATYISQLNSANPVGAVDPKAQGDDHIRLVKSTLQASFPNITGAMTKTHTELNAMASNTGFAAPSVAVSPTAASAGSATTVLRSDAKLTADLSVAWTFTGAINANGNLTISNSDPLLNIIDSSQGVDAKRWSFNANGALDLYAVNDAGSVFTSALSIARSGSNITSMTFGQSGNNTAYDFAGTGTKTFRAPSGSANSIWTDGTVTCRYYSSGGSTAANFGAQGNHIFNLLQNDIVRLSFAVGGANAAFSVPVVITAASDAMRLVGDATYLSIYNTANTTRTGYLQGDTTNGVFLASDLSGKHVTLTSNGGLARFSEDNGSTLFRIGYRNIPVSTTSTTLVAADVAKCVPITAAIAIPVSVFAAGDAVSIYNDSAAALNITIAGGTLRLAGTASTGTRALAARGMCTLWFKTGGATPEVIASGNVS